MITPHWQFKWPFFGNDNIINFLEKGIANQQLTHCYIIAGIANLGKYSLARAFAQALLCKNLKSESGELPCGVCANCQQVKRNIHSDLNIIQPEEGKKNISIEQVRDFIYTMHLGSFAGNYKIGIIKEAETLSNEAANALLKTLEEPQEKVIIVLVASQAEKLPATIRSRSQTLTLKPVASSIIYDHILQEYDITRDGAKQIARLAAGRPALATKLAQDKDFFQDTKSLLNKIIQLMQSNATVKLQIIDEFLAGTKSEESQRQTFQILQLWQSIIRDCLLLKYNLNHLIVNDINIDIIKTLSLSTAELLKINKSLEESRQYLVANVNPKLVLEKVYL